MNSPILSGAMVLRLSSVRSTPFTLAAPPGISIRPAASGIRRRTRHLPLSQTVPVTWPRSVYRTKQVWSSMRTWSSIKSFSTRARVSKSSGGELRVLHDWEKLIK